MEWTLLFLPLICLMPLFNKWCKTNRARKVISALVHRSFNEGNGYVGIYSRIYERRLRRRAKKRAMKYVKGI